MIKDSIEAAIKAIAEVNKVTHGPVVAEKVEGLQRSALNGDITIGKYIEDSAAFIKEHWKGKLKIGGGGKTL